MTNFPEIPEDKHSSKLSFTDNGNTQIPVSKPRFKTIINLDEKSENVGFSYVELVYVDENEIVEINKKYLERDYVTDIISFRYDEDNSNQFIEGTLYCCSSRISEQSQEFKTPVKKEFERVFIHGLLHLIGYNDQTEPDKKKMTKLEDFYLKA